MTEKNTQTTNEGLERKVMAIVIAVTLFVTVLLGILIYQIVSIVSHNNKIEKLEEENARLEQALQKDERDLAYYESEIGKENLAHQFGWIEED